MPLPKAPTQMGEMLKGESNRKTQTRKKLKKESSDASKSSKQKKVDVNKSETCRIILVILKFKNPKIKNSQNQNPCRQKCRQGLDQ